MCPSSRPTTRVVAVVAAVVATVVTTPAVVLATVLAALVAVFKVCAIMSNDPSPLAVGFCSPVALTDNASEGLSFSKGASMLKDELI